MKRLLVAMFWAVAGVMPAAAEDTWDGTWIGETPGSAVQLVFAGNALLGFFWAGDYVDMRASYSRADGVVSITWTRGQGILTREGPTSARLQVLQRNQPDITVLVRPEE